MRLVVVIAIVVGALGIGSCATISQAQNQCSAFGYSQGTPEYANCVQQQYQANQTNMQQRFLNASRIVNEGTTGSGSSTYRGAAGGSGFLKSSYVSGMNRICVYDRLGSAYVMTIGATQLCPLSAP